METPQEVIAGVVEEVKSAVAAVEAAPEQIVEAIKEEITKIEITMEEKLNIRNLENEFLKNTMEIQRLQGLVQGLQTQFPNYIQSLVKKYNVDEKTFVFDAKQLLFSKKQ